MAYRNRNFDRNNYGGSISRNVDPWDTSNDWGMRGGGNNMGGGGGGGGGGHNNGGGVGGGNFNPNSSTELANHLLQLLRNNGNQGPPSLLDLPQADMRGYGYGGGRNSGGGDRFDDRRMGGGGGGHHMNNNRPANHSNNNNNRRGGVGNGPRGGGGHHPQQQQHMQSKGNNNAGGGGGAGHMNQQKNNRNSGGIRKPNSLDRSKKVLAKNSNNSKNNNATKSGPADKSKATNTAAAAPADQKSYDDEEGEGANANGGESVYADVPSDMFYCHLCKKHMWDCTSFENHVKGRTHQMMKEGVEESYRLKANMIRQEAKIDEQLKSIEVERLKRIGKSMKNSNVHREYCQMCDLHFYGHLSTHRKSEGHLSLKKFLHPKCTDCNDEFQNRIEFDAHLLSREHMLKCAAKTNRDDFRRKNQLTIFTEVDEAADVREEKAKVAATATATAGGDGVTEGATADGTTSEAAAEGGEAAAENGEATGEGDDKADKGEPENPDVILDYIEGTTEIGPDVEARIPKYKCVRAIATSMIAKLECFECKLCNRFFDNETTAEIHSRTVFHHKQFAKFLTEKANETKIAQKRAAATIENEKRKRARTEKESAPDAAAGQNGTGSEETATNGEATAVADTTEEEVVQPEKKAKVEEIYDPYIVTDDDVPMAEADAPVVTAPPVETPKPVAAPATPAAATPVPATPSPAPTSATNTPKSAGSGSGTPRGGRGGNRGNNRGRGRGRRF